MSSKPTGYIEATISQGSKYDVSEGSQGRPDLVRIELPNTTPENNPLKTSEVTVSLGLTKSLGNYEFARFDVLVKDACLPEHKDETFKKLYDVASEYLSKINADLKNGKKGNS